MASVVFLRGANVGGHRTFQPALLAKELAALDVVNVGAAGTFVVRGKVGDAALRAEMARRLPFDAEFIICPARDLVKLARAEPFGANLSETNVRPYVSVLAKSVQTLPRLPIRRPDNDEWQVKVLGVVGRFALSLHRRLGRALVYPNEVVEKRLGVSATTRNWNTISAICAILTAQ
jgi:uncharacterized protein (DUF1697 family)